MYGIFKELINFAFFDKDVPLETKSKMREAFNNPSKPNQIKRATINLQVIEMS